MDSIVTIDSITKEYQSGDKVVKAVNDLSLEIGKGQFVVILGPSGSGKTTLLNIISGLVSPTDGKVMVGDKEITSLSDDDATKFRA